MQGSYAYTYGDVRKACTINAGMVDEYVVISSHKFAEHFEPDEKKLLKCGVVTIDENDRILNMTEKSPTPATHWCCPPFYYYTREDAKLVQKGIDSGCGTDAPGSYIAWLCTQVEVHAMEMPGKRYDIGNLESYEKVKMEYRGIGE